MSIDRACLEPSRISHRQAAIGRAERASYLSLSRTVLTALGDGTARNVRTGENVIL